ncbi:hypothetical protein [Saccharopolyspora taberi]|uniref:Uncharacterized protein n=1 Tax=Saccharopolyspora taberi TaxID=60895 RepID=A0ABN3VPR6_9PSEU
MRSLSRAVVVGALALPLAFASVGFASAADANNKDDGHNDESSHCWYFSCNEFWSFSDNDTQIQNWGIIHNTDNSDNSTNNEFNF